MNFELFESVHIVHKNVDGVIVDIDMTPDGTPLYTVESSVRGYVDDSDAYPGDFPLFDCTEDQLILLK